MYIVADDFRRGYVLPLTEHLWVFGLAAVHVADAWSLLL